MSQKVSRKVAVNEDKDKKQTDTPPKDTKKKMAATVEKDKQSTEKVTDKSEKIIEKNDKPEKVEKKDNKTENKDTKTEKRDSKTEIKDTKTEKKDGKIDKKDSKTEKKDNKIEKKDKPEEKKPELVEKKDEKKKEESGKGEKSGKPERSDEVRIGTGPAGTHNGADVVIVHANGAGCDETVNGNGAASAESDSDSVPLVIDDGADEQFPELAYDEDTSDASEPPPSRSRTRRSQVKVTRTPETPRPASDKQTDRDTNLDDSKEHNKVMKLKEDVPPPSDRKLRSSDSPKPQDKKTDKKQDKPADSPKSGDNQAHQRTDGDAKKDGAEKTGDKPEKMQVEIVVEVEDDGESRKPDTNYSRSRVRVSPYRRADVTASSTAANYTGNNTTMEMDITEMSSFLEEGGLDQSPYLRGLRSIRGRSSYKLLKDLPPRRDRSAAHSSSQEHTRPTGTVVGRKRKPEGAVGAVGAEGAEAEPAAGTKRARLLQRVADSFRRSAPRVSARSSAEIVGINTDLPLSAPVAADPETLKHVAVPLAPAPERVAVPLARASDRDARRCVLM